MVFVWAFFGPPESKGRTFEKLDWLFANATPTRRFDKAKAEVFTQGAENP